MAAAVPAIIIRKEREIVSLFATAGATTPAAARDPADIGVHRHLVFDRLVRRSVLREADAGRYYLDEETWSDLRHRRRRIATVMLVIVLAVFAAAIAGGWIVVGTRR